MTAPAGVPGGRITAADTNVVIAHSRFRECQDRRRAISAALRHAGRPPTNDAYVVHVGAVIASPRPLNRKPC
jgi:hypothetical protein